MNTYINQIYQSTHIIFLQTIFKECERLAEEQLDDLQMVCSNFNLPLLSLLALNDFFQFLDIHFAFA